MVDEHSGDSEIGTHRETFEQTPMSSHQAFKVALALKLVLEEYWVWRFETNELVIRRASNSSPVQAAFPKQYTLYFILSLQIVISHSDSISVVKYTRVAPIEFEICPAG